MIQQIKKLLPYLKPYKYKFVISSLCMVGVSVLTAVTRWLLKPLVDRIFVSKDIKLLMWLVVLIPILYLLNGMLAYIKSYINIFIANNIVKNLREDTYKRLQEISIDYFITKTSTGATIAKLTNDLNNIFLLLSKVPTVIVTDTLTIVGLVIVLFYLSAKFAILSLIVLPIALFPIYIFSKKLRKYSQTAQTEIANLYKNLQESISAISITKVFCQEKKEIKNFSNTNTKVYSSILKFSKTELLSSPVMEFIGALGVAVVLFLGGNDVISGRWTPGGFFAFLAVVLSFYQPLKRISEINPIIQQGVVSITRVFSILEHKSSIIEIPNPMIAKFEKNIRFHNVSFSYDGNKKIINNINFEIKKGQKVAIVGPSGAGKSTIVNLLLRFYDVSSGGIFIDNIDIKNFSLSSLRKLFGVVTQDTFLFNNTIKYNISYGLQEEVTEEELVRVTKLAYIYETIQNLPDKFDTVVGERGYTLSGGERQRLAIARVLLTNPEIFIFDEPTSALDAESEFIVMKAIENVISQKTVILITHRLNLVTKFDYIYVFSNGEIVEHGTHQELLSNGKFYPVLLSLQQLPISNNN